MEIPHHMDPVHQAQRPGVAPACDANSVLLKMPPREPPRYKGSSIPRSEAEKRVLVIPIRYRHSQPSIRENSAQSSFYNHTDNEVCTSSSSGSSSSCQPPTQVAKNRLSNCRRSESTRDTQSQTSLLLSAPQRDPESHPRSPLHFAAVAALAAPVRLGEGLENPCPPMPPANSTLGLSDTVDTVSLASDGARNARDLMTHPEGLQSADCSFKTSDTFREEYTVLQLTQKEMESATLGTKLGRGSSGVVQRTTVVTDAGVRMIVAVKEMNKGPSSDQEIVNMRILSGHRHFVEFYGHLERDTSRFLFMEWIEGGSLDAIMRSNPLTLVGIQQWMRQLLSAVKDMHSHRIIHHDLKTGNILLTKDGTLKVIDFGCSVRDNSQCPSQSLGSSSSIRGTPWFIAPETGDPNYKESPAIDIWSVGCIGICFLRRKIWRFDAVKESETMKIMYLISKNKTSPSGLPTEAIIEGLHLSAREKEQVQEYRRLLERCFIINPEERPTAKELLADPFFSTTKQNFAVGLDDPDYPT